MVDSAWLIEKTYLQKKVTKKKKLLLLKDDRTEKYRYLRELEGGGELIIGFFFQDWDYY